MVVEQIAMKATETSPEMEDTLACFLLPYVEE